MDIIQLVFLLLQFICCTAFQYKILYFLHMYIYLTLVSLHFTIKTYNIILLHLKYMKVLLIVTALQHSEYLTVSYIPALLVLLKNMIRLVFLFHSFMYCTCLHQKLHCLVYKKHPTPLFSLVVIHYILQPPNYEFLPCFTK